MKGFKDSDGKFRPITISKGIRKKSNKSTKTIGMKTKTGIRKAVNPDVQFEQLLDEKFDLEFELQSDVQNLINAHWDSPTLKKKITEEVEQITRLEAELETADTRRGTRKKRIKPVLEETVFQKDIEKTQSKIIQLAKRNIDDPRITPLIAENRVMIQRRNKKLFGNTIPTQALIPYVLPKVNPDGSDAFYINIFDAFRRAEQEGLPVIFNNINGDVIQV